MNRIQKMSWFFVIAFGFALFISLAATLLIYLKFGASIAPAGFAFMGLAGLGGLASAIFRRHKNEVIDERDRAIQKTAKSAGFVAAFIIAGLGCMLPFFILGPDGTIQVKWLTNIWLCIFMTAFLVDAITTLILYGRDKSGVGSQVSMETNP